MIPLSSRIDKYRWIMEKKEKAGKPCDILHIIKRDDSRESAFLIQDMFPITEEYIEREYTIVGKSIKEEIIKLLSMPITLARIGKIIWINQIIKRTINTTMNNL